MRIAALVPLVFFLALPVCAQQPASAPATAPIFNLQEVMIPVRDGVHLQTVILTPVGATKPLPILFRRTPYGVPEKAPEQMPASLKELAQDGYIFVIQNLRGRFKSEGVFLLSSWVDLKDPKATNETTDAYDSIEWLVKNVPNNNGKVGMYGVSYDGLTTALTLLHPHPALKAISEQASPVDQWMNDDDHRTARSARATTSSMPSWSRPTKIRTHTLNSKPMTPMSGISTWVHSQTSMPNIFTDRFHTGIRPSIIPIMTSSGRKKPGFASFTPQACPI